MNADTILDALSEIDDALIEEAEPGKQKAPLPLFRKAAPVLALAAAFALVIGIGSVSGIFGAKSAAPQSAEMKQASLGFAPEAPMEELAEDNAVGSAELFEGSNERDMNSDERDTRSNDLASNEYSVMRSGTCEPGAQKKEVPESKPEEAAETVHCDEALLSAMDAAEPDAEFDVRVDLILPEDRTPEEELAWLSANGIRLSVRDDMLTARLTAEQIRSFPVNAGTCYALYLSE